MKNLKHIIIVASVLFSTPIQATFNENETSLNGTSPPTRGLSVRVILPDVDVIGTVNSVNASVVDTLGKKHAVSLKFKKTIVDKQWSLNISSSDTAAGSVKQGTAAGDQYGGETPVLLNFDNTGRLANFEYPRGTTLGTVPDAYFAWNMRTPASSPISLDLGTAGANDGLRIMGNQYMVTSLNVLSE